MIEGVFCAADWWRGAPCLDSGCLPTLADQQFILRQTVVERYTAGSTAARQSIAADIQGLPVCASQGCVLENRGGWQAGLTVWFGVCAVCREQKSYGVCCKHVCVYSMTLLAPGFCPPLRE